MTSAKQQPKLSRHMNTKAYIVLGVILLTVYTHVSAQDSTHSRSLFGEGLTLQGGIGFTAVRDEYISNEKYSGSIPYWGAIWSKYHETYAFRLHLEYQHTTNLKNYDVSAELTQFVLGLDYLYPIAWTTILSRKVAIFLGPTVEVFEHYRRENIAGSQNLHSNVALISGGVRSEAFCPLIAHLNLRAAAQLTLLSLGTHSVNSNGSDESPVKFLTPFQGIDADGEIAISYRLTKSFTTSAGYRFNVTRISAWDFFISADDDLILSLTYDL